MTSSGCLQHCTVVIYPLSSCWTGNKHTPTPTPPPLPLLCLSLHLSLSHINTFMNIASHTLTQCTRTRTHTQSIFFFCDKGVIKIPLMLLLLPADAATLPFLSSSLFCLLVLFVAVHDMRHLPCKFWVTSHVRAVCQPRTAAWNPKYEHNSTDAQ